LIAVITVTTRQKIWASKLEAFSRPPSEEEEDNLMTTTAITTDQAQPTIEVEIPASFFSLKSSDWDAHQ